MTVSAGSTLPSHASLEWLTQCRQPHSFAIASNGLVCAYVLESLTTPRGESAQATLWVADLACRTVRQWFGAGAHVALPSWSPRGDGLAWVDGASRSSRLCIADAQDRTPRSFDLPPGRVEWLQWAADAQSLLLLVAEPGCYDGSGVVPGADDEDPRIQRPVAAWRRLWRIDAATGALTRINHDGFSVLEAAWNGEGPVAAVVASDPGGSGWYHSALACIDPRGAPTRLLIRPSRWYFEGLTMAPSGLQVAVLEGYCSDAGLLNGHARVVELSNGRVLSPWPGLTTLSAIQFIDDHTLGWTASEGTGSAAGTARLDGSIDCWWSGREHLGGSIDKPQVSWLADGAAFVSARQAFGAAPELVIGRREALDVITLHNQRWADATPAAHVEQLSWHGRDGLRIDGMLMRPDAIGEQACIVLVHGGPTWAWGQFHADTWPNALALVQAGFAVLLPNPRGSNGRGAEFAEAVIDDIGGEDLHDILGGVEHVAARGLIDRSRVGIAGLSYGGFMAAWAPTQTEVFRAAVAVSIVADWPSCILTSDAHDQSLVFLSGDPFGPDSRHRQRSPVSLPQRRPTPTLIVMGADDRCTPASQGEELYRKLVREGVVAELITYPREGHGLAETDHVVDAHRRLVSWFRRHLMEDLPDEHRHR